MPYAQSLLHPLFPAVPSSSMNSQREPLAASANLLFYMMPQLGMWQAHECFGTANMQAPEGMLHAYLLAYLSVLFVSSKSASQLEIQLISTVSAFPPKLSCSSRVSLESLGSYIHNNSSPKPKPAPEPITSKIGPCLKACKPHVSYIRVRGQHPCELTVADCLHASKPRICAGPCPARYLIACC